MSGFKKAVKSGLKLRMAITGPSGSGKTYTALRLATAMGLPIAFIDTEHRSASKYADLFDFDVVEMQAPFHPKRFVEGIKLAQREGYKCVVIDSLSHAWNGPGGILELVEEASARIKGNSYAAWKDVTPHQNDLIESIVGTDIHIIATMRSKMDYVQQKDDKGYTKIQKVGMAPIQRDGFEYEFDVVMDMDTDHRGIISKTRCPELTDGVYKFPGETVAGILNEWLNSGAASVDIAKAKKEIEILTPSNYFVDAPDTENPDNIENVIEPDDSPSDMALEVIGEWTSRLKAQAWAVEIGACKNDIEATNSMYKVIARHGGKVTKENVNAVYFDFYCRQIEKLEEMQQKPELMAA